MKKRFLFPMRRHEAVGGWIYLPVHAFILPPLLILLNARLLPSLSIDALTDANLNLLYYAVSFIIVFAILFRYLTSSFSDLIDNLWPALAGVCLGYILYYIGTYAVNLLIYFLNADTVNPNTEQINEAVRLNVNMMKAVGVCLAPIVEESLFRGVVFGTIRKRSRAAAYIISVLLFAFYHLWSFFLSDFDWKLFLYILQYIPASVALAWCYEHGRSIWAPIFLHMLVNFISISISFG